MFIGRRRWLVWKFCSLLLIVLVSPAGAEKSPAFELNIEDFTQAELDAAYRALSPEDRRIIDTWPRDERLKLLALTALEYRRREPPLPTDPPALPPPPQLYTPDPLLQKAFDYAGDQKRPVEDAIRVFEQYIAANPGSMFIPEIYFRIGELYSTHRRDGQRTNRQMQVRYYSAAREGFGRKLSYLNIAAWGTIANRMKDLDTYMAYYDWLLEMAEHATLKDIYPIRNIQQTFNGRQPIIDPQGLERRLTTMRVNLNSYISTAEKNILHRAAYKYDWLAALSTRFPGTALGDEAARRLARIDEMQGVHDTLDSDEFMEPYVKRAEIVPNAIPGNEPKVTEISTNIVAQKGDTRSWRFVFSVGGMVVAAVALVVLVKRWMSRTSVV